MSQRPPGTPRHLAGSTRTPRPPAAVSAALDELASVPDPAADAPAVRVHRSRLAFAVSVTLAALPILFVDNFAANADTGDPATVLASREDDRASASAPTPGAPQGSVAVTGDPSTAAAAVESPTVALASVETPATTPTTVAETATVQALATPTAPPPTAAPPTTAPAATTVAAADKPPAGDPSDPATWRALARCESNGNWATNTGNGYYGGLQFSLESWRHVGGTGYPHQATPEEQIKRGRILQARYGWDQWPTCSRRLGFR